METDPPTGLIIAPDPDNNDLCEFVVGIDQNGQRVTSRIVNEKPLTIYLNSQEIVTLMTIGDWPDLLAIGYLRNQNMLADDDVVESVDYDAGLGVAVVRTQNETNFEEKLQKRVRTSGCAQGTIFGDVVAEFDKIYFEKTEMIKISWIYSLTKKINVMPSLYLAAGAIHGTVLCARDQPLVYMEDVGRHNAVDKIAGWMWQSGRQTGGKAGSKLLYTTGRLTSEMVIKTAMMGIPVLVSRSGFTSWGVQLARQVGLTLIGRARGRRFLVLSGAERLVYDAAPSPPSGSVDAMAVDAMADEGKGKDQ